MTAGTMKTKKQIGKRKDSQETLRAKRREKAAELAATATTTVTLRIPVGLDDWINRYWRQAYPEKISKKDLITEALCLLYEVRGEP